MIFVPNLLAITESTEAIFGYVSLTSRPKEIIFIASPNDSTLASFNAWERSLALFLEPSFIPIDKDLSTITANMGSLIEARTNERIGSNTANKSKHNPIDRKAIRMLFLTEDKGGTGFL